MPTTFVKSFFDESIQAAMKRARVELGTDALLINSREAPPEARHLGRYEVVFGLCSEPISEPASLPFSPPALAPPSRLERVEALRLKVEKIRASLARRALAAPARRIRNALIAQALITAGVEPALAREIDEAARQRAARRAVPRIGAPRAAAGSEAHNLRLEAAEEIAAHFEVEPEIGRVTALVGPGGCGKTSTLVKLAIQQGLARGRTVHLISTDTHRIGGAEQLRAYAGILGANFQAVENASALAQAIESAPPSALVLIDTPGYGAASVHQLGRELGSFLTRRQDIDTHLVLTACTRVEDLYQTARRYDVFRPSKLAFTRLDEASSVAAVFCVAARCNYPLSFLSTGQSIPEDLEPASKEKIVESLVRQLPSAMEAAA
jgi:flagellar biosynthesis protein FlhF